MIGKIKRVNRLGHLFWPKAETGKADYTSTPHSLGSRVYRRWAIDFHAISARQSLSCGDVGSGSRNGTSTERRHSVLHLAWGKRGAARALLDATRAAHQPVWSWPVELRNDLDTTRTHSFAYDYE